MVSAPRRCTPAHLRLPSSTTYVFEWFHACLPPSAATIRRKPVNLPSIPRIGPTPRLVRRWLAATFPLLRHLYPTILVSELIGRCREADGIMAEEPSMPIRPLPLPRECHLHHHIAAPTYLALPISDGDIRRPALTQCPLLYAWPPCLAKVGLASHSEARPPPPDCPRPPEGSSHLLQVGCAQVCDVDAAPCPTPQPFNPAPLLLSSSS